MAKILIIDDDRTLCHDMLNVIAGWGHDVFSAETAKEGFKAIEDWRPDVVLCDLNLPDGSGLDIMRLINSVNTEFFNVMVLFISSEPAARIVTEALNLGADDYLIKPVNYDVLKARIHGLLRKQEKYEVGLNAVSNEKAVLDAAKFAASFSLCFLLTGLASISMIYWFKVVLGINLFVDVHFSDVLPF